MLPAHSDTGRQSPGPRPGAPLLHPADLPLLTPGPPPTGRRSRPHRRRSAAWWGPSWAWAEAASVGRAGRCRHPGWTPSAEKETGRTGQPGPGSGRPPPGGPGRSCSGAASVQPYLRLWGDRTQRAPRRGPRCVIETVTMNPLTQT